MRTVALILCALWWSGSALAQPVNVTRTLKKFDFEERSFNVEELPVDWQKVEGEGLPFYVNGRLSRDQARSGRYAFRFDLNGGSLIYRFPSGKVPVKTGAHYRVEAWVRTTPMKQARARITAYFTNRDGRAIGKSIRHSEPYSAAAGEDPWRRLGVELTADDPDAAFVVIELGLVQPSVYRPNLVGERELYTQDIRGTAWFDDVAVSQVPRVTMSTDQPGNIFPVHVPVTVRVTVNDRFTEDLSASLVIRDATGAVLMQQSQQLDLAGARTIGDQRKQLVVTLPQLSTGWYDVRVSMSSQGTVLGEQRVAIVKLADDGRAVPIDPRVGVIATHLPVDAWSELPRMLPLLGAGRVKLAVWSRTSDAQQSSGVRLDELLESLERQGIVPTACLTGLPPAVSAAVGGEGGWLDLLKAPRDRWQPALAYLVARHANHVDRWQLGDDGDDAFVTNPQMRGLYDRVRSEFAQLIDNPDLAAPWPAWYELDDRAPPSVALSIPPSVLPHQVPLYVEHGGDRRAALADAGEPGIASIPQSSRISLSLQALDRDQYGREMQIRDFAQRFAYALSSAADRIDLPLPFDAEPDAAGEDGALLRQPQEMLLVLRTLTMMLGNARFLGRVPLADNVEAFLFDRDGQGLLMMWSRGSERSARELAINFGARPVCVDLWGNVTPLLTAGDAGRGKARLHVGPMPVFIVGINAEMMRLRSSVGWNNDRVESSFRPHVRKLTFTNPYRTAISGQVRLSGPNGWTLSPPVLQFSLNPGETLRRDVTIEFPYNSFAGVKPVTVEFALSGEQETSFTVPAPLKLGLSDVGLQTIALRDGTDVVVQQIITNYGEKPIDYSAFAVFPGQARQERLVTQLAPGRTTIKKYRFEGVQQQQATRVRSGIRELDGTRILNDEVEVR